MHHVKRSLYRDMPFCLETRFDDFYIYLDIEKIPEKCKSYSEEIIKCRTIGILHSINGQYYLNDFNSSGIDSKQIVQVSMMYMQSPPQSTVIPYPVQIFGTLQWKNRPVIFSRILQVINVATAMRLKNSLSGITSLHLANDPRDLRDAEDPT